MERGFVRIVIECGHARIRNAAKTQFILTAAQRICITLLMDTIIVRHDFWFKMGWPSLMLFWRFVRV